MDNNQMPPVQNPVSAAPASAPATPGVSSAQKYYTAEQVEKIMESKKDVAGIIKTILVIILSLTTLTFVGLFVWMFTQYNDVKTDVESQISVAVSAAKVEQAEADEAEFLEREKYPFRSFSGPADYGELSFDYPKTWSLYVAKDALDGGDYEAYFNPIQVDSTDSEDSIYALKLSILNRTYESMTAWYQDQMEKEDSNLTVSSIVVNGVTGSQYTGTIPETEFNGKIVVFKIRDKTVVMETYSLLFEEDFNKVVESVTFNS